MDGVIVGSEVDGALEGTFVGDADGCDVEGDALGSVVGDRVSPGSEGATETVGELVGLFVGTADGMGVGENDEVGLAELVGAEVGAADGDNVGTGVPIGAKVKSILLPSPPLNRLLVEPLSFPATTAATTTNTRAPTSRAVLAIMIPLRQGLAPVTHPGNHPSSSSSILYSRFPFPLDIPLVSSPLVFPPPPPPPLEDVPVETTSG
mmetsp:Transcript_1205/g.1677  ORF Transcript_1205/g.1677 Transcript_1205/m.1677 type:complete len:206 (-) Transcript_1205:400-1017(-)